MAKTEPTTDPDGAPEIEMNRMPFGRWFRIYIKHRPDAFSCVSPLLSSGLYSIIWYFARNATRHSFIFQIPAALYAA